jgi:esterase/lipase superfamily enzyme
MRRIAKRYSLLICIVAVSLVAADSYSQPANPLAEQSQPCESKQGIEASIKDLQQLLLMKRRENEVRKSAALEKEISDIEGSIVAAIYKLDCFRSTEALRAGDQFVEITNYYATNRQPTGDSEPSRFYGKDDAAAVQYGKTEVTIPLRHVVGDLELPSLWKLERFPDPNKHFVLKSVEPLESGGALGEIRATLEKSSSKSVLLFVHGFNVTFETAALRTAQLANDLQFPGLVMFFSWPSDGATSGYAHDEESAVLSKPMLDRVLEDLNQQPFEEIYLLSHSMGTRILAEVLASRQQKGVGAGKVKEIVFAAPDINTRIFERDLAPALANMSNVGRTIYASSEDLALKASVAIHEYARVGETNGGVSVFPGFETIDASKADSYRREWGHSYIFDSPLVLADFADSVVRHTAIARRNLKKAGKLPNTFWVLE